MFGSKVRSIWAALVAVPVAIVIVAAVGTPAGAAKPTAIPVVKSFTISKTSLPNTGGSVVLKREAEVRRVLQGDGFAGAAGLSEVVWVQLRQLHEDGHLRVQQGPESEPVHLRDERQEQGGKRSGNERGRDRGSRFAPDLVHES